MDRRTATATSARRRRRLLTLAGFVLAVIVIAILIQKEQIDVLYVLATFGVAALLVVVALADFGEARTSAPSAPFDDAAAIGGTGTVGTNRTTAAKSR
jgi:peptidoglycan/LPS O-acetylase OafA/YrhL